MPNSNGNKVDSTTSDSNVVSSFPILNDYNDKIEVSSIVEMNDPSTLLLSSLSSSSSSSNVINMIKQQQRRRQRLYISTRGDDNNNNSNNSNNNNNSIIPSTTTIITRESMLWFQSVRRDWLNSPRTPIQPIILPLITFETYIDCNNNNNNTTTISKTNNNNNTAPRIEHDYTKTNIDHPNQPNCDMNNYTNKSSTTTPAINTTATTTLSTNTQKNDEYRKRLIEFYQQYNPSKLNDNITMIDSTLQKYKNREEELFQKLYIKYCNHKEDIRYLSIPTNINPNRPIVFLEFEYNMNERSDSSGSCYSRQQRGIIQIQLFHDYTPYTVENFRCLCTGEKGMMDDHDTIRLCYINTIIHRIVPNMCIQGGDITYNQNDTNSIIGTGGRSIYPKMGQIPKSPIQTDLWGNFIDEIPFLSHSCTGLLSMANNGRNRNNSQFFITLRPLIHLNGKHVVFGKVIDGMNVIYDIATYNTTTTAATNKTQQQSLFNDNNQQQPVRIIDCGEIRHDDNGDKIWIRASDMNNNNNDNSSKHDNNNNNNLDNDNFEPNQSNHIFGNSSGGSNNDNHYENKSASHSFGTEGYNACSSTISHNGCDIDTTIKNCTIDNTSPLITASSKDVSFCSTTILETTNTKNTTMISMFEDSTTDSTVKVDEINTKRYNDYCNPTESNEEKPIPLQLFSHSTEQSLSNCTNDKHDEDCSFDDNINNTGRVVLMSDTLTIVDKPDLNESGAKIVEISLPNMTTTTETEFTTSKDTEHKMDVICTSLDQPSPVTVTPFISTSSIPSTNSQSSNDESTTLVDISYCDTTSHMSNAETIGSAVSTSSSIAEQIEWLHRLMDDAQTKLRQTRQKLEERIHIIKSRPLPSSSSSKSSSSLLLPHHETVTQQTIPSIPEHYTLNIPSSVYFNNNKLSPTTEMLPSTLKLR